MLLFKIILSSFLFLLNFYNFALADFESGLKAYNEGKFKQAIEHWLPIAEEGNSNAQYNLGLMYHNGQGVKQDFDEAAKWFLYSAEQGNIRSMQLLSTMHVLGRGVEKDFIQSYIWATIASKNGDENSLAVLNGLKEEMTASQINKANKLTMDKCKKFNFNNCKNL